jgi:toxin-antitoxin system PIN domain toxin
MILIDANLLLYAYNPESEYHKPAKEWLERTFSSAEPVKLSWQSILAFLRITTNIHVFREPLTPAEAITIVSDWLSQPAVGIVQPGERHWEILAALIKQAQIQGPLMMDAHLAALALENGLTLCTHDNDFRRFLNLRLNDPLNESE